MRIALIDDDEAILDSLAMYLRRRQATVDCHGSAEAYLAADPECAGVDCIVADVRMPGLSGLDLVRRLRQCAAPAPIVLITGHGDVDMAVAAIKLGAADFIEKPFDEARLFDTVCEAVERRAAERDEAADLAALRARADSLSERQRQVMKLAASGLSNKEIGARLGISPKTVEIHRAWMMERMGARNVAELVRMEMRLQPS